MKLCALACFLTLHIERVCTTSVGKDRKLVRKPHTGYIAFPAGRFVKTTQCTKEQRIIFKKFSIKEPPEILKIL